MSPTNSLFESDFQIHSACSETRKVNKKIRKFARDFKPRVHEIKKDYSLINIGLFWILYSWRLKTANSDIKTKESQRLVDKLVPIVDVTGEKEVKKFMNAVRKGKASGYDCMKAEFLQVFQNKKIVIIFILV